MLPLPELVIAMLTEPTPVDVAWVASPEYCATIECMPGLLKFAV